MATSSFPSTSSPQRGATRIASSLALVAIVLLAGCAGSSRRSLVGGLSPTPAGVPIRIFAKGDLPACPYTPIGRVTVTESVEEAADSAAWEPAYREIRKMAREMGGHAVLVDSVEVRAGRRVPDPATIEDLVPESRDSHPLSGALTKDDEDRARPRPERELDPDTTEELEVGLSFGKSGIRRSDETEDRVTIRAVVVYFPGGGCER